MPLSMAGAAHNRDGISEQAINAPRFGVLCSEFLIKSVSRKLTELPQQLVHLSQVDGVPRRLRSVDEASRLNYDLQALTGIDSGA